MITKLEVSASGGLELTDDLKKYINKKIGRLDRYMPRNSRKAAHAEVKLKQENSKSTEKLTAEVIMYLPHGNMTAKESTLNVYAAIDIVEAKLRNQLRKHKEKTTNHKSDRKGVMRKIANLRDKDFWGGQN